MKFRYPDPAAPGNNNSAAIVSGAPVPSDAAIPNAAVVPNGSKWCFGSKWRSRSKLGSCSNWCCPSYSSWIGGYEYRLCAQLKGAQKVHGRTINFQRNDRLYLCIASNLGRVMANFVQLSFDFDSTSGFLRNSRFKCY